MVMWEVYVMVVYGYLVVLVMVLFPLIVDIYGEHMVYDKTVKDKEFKEKDYFGEKEHLKVKTKQHWKGNNKKQIKKKEHIVQDKQVNQKVINDKEVEEHMVNDKQVKEKNHKIERNLVQVRAY